MRFPERPGGPLMWRRATLLTVTVLLVTACGTEADASASAPIASVAADPSAPIASVAADSSAPSAGATPVLIEPAGAVEEFHDLEAGTYVVDDPFPLRVSFAVPAGWVTWAYTSEASQLNVVKAEFAEVSFEIVDNVSGDPCTQLLDPPVGPSVDDLVTALSDLDGFEVSAPADITIDGFSGKQLTMTAPTDHRCRSLLTWRTTTRQNGVGPSEVNEVRILDVDGVRLVISVAHAPSLTDDARSEIDAVVGCIQIGQ